MSKSKELQSKLDECPTEVKLYVRKLESKCEKLQEKIADLESDNVLYDFKVTALQKQIEKFQKGQVVLTDYSAKNLEDRLRRSAERTTKPGPA